MSIGEMSETTDRKRDFRNWLKDLDDDTIPVGDGTSSSPYLIANATQLDWFRSQVNGGETSIHGALIANITYNQGKDVAGWDGKSSNTFTSFTPICTASGGYTGTFDGRGNTISGLFINTSEYTRVGLFGYIGSGGIVKDVIMTNYYIATSYVGASNLQAGSVCGMMNDGAAISGCSCNGTVDISADCSEAETIASAYVGGICGYASSSSYYIKDCTFSGTVYESGKVGRVLCGGIVGYNGGSASVSSNTMGGTVDVSGSATTYIHCGGIVGYNGGSASVSSNTMSGTVDVSGSATTYILCGGIVGSNYGAASDNTMSGSVDVSGSVMTNIHCGGIVGSNYGAVSSNTMSGSVDVSGSATTYIHCGGIVGYNGGTASDNTMSGSVDVSGSVTTYILCGGIVGYNYGAASDNTMSGSVDVSGSVTTYIHCGGIVGYNGGTAYVYENSLYGSYACTGSYGTTLSLNAIVGGGSTSSGYVYDNYDYTSDTASTAALESASASVASVESTVIDSVHEAVFAGEGVNVKGTLYVSECTPDGYECTFTYGDLLGADALNTDLSECLSLGTTIGVKLAAGRKRDFGEWLKDLDDDVVAEMMMSVRLLLIYEGGNDGSSQAVTHLLKERLDALKDEIGLRKTRYFNEE